MIFNTFFLGCKMAKCIIIKGRGGVNDIYECEGNAKKETNYSKGGSNVPTS